MSTSTGGRLRTSHAGKRHAQAGTTSTTVQKALMVLDQVGKSTAGVGVRELARILDLGKSTTSRLLITLEQEGFVRYDEATSRYFLGTKILELAGQHQRNSEIRAVARPHMLDAQKRTGETVFLGVLDGLEVVIIDRVDSPNPLRMMTDLGTREPAHCTALGKILLAHLPDAATLMARASRLRASTPSSITSPRRLKEELEQVRAKGFAVDDQEHVQGVRCVAAAIRNFETQVIAAVSISGPIFRLDVTRIPEVANTVKGVADAISTELGS